MAWTIGDETGTNTGMVGGLAPPLTAQRLVPPAPVAPMPAQTALQQAGQMQAAPWVPQAARPTLGGYGQQVSPADVRSVAGLVAPVAPAARGAGGFTPPAGSAPPAQSADPLRGLSDANRAMLSAPLAPPPAPAPVTPTQGIFRNGNTYSDMPRYAGEQPATLSGGTFNIIPAAPAVAPGAGGYVMQGMGVTPPLGMQDRADTIAQLQDLVARVANNRNPGINDLVSANLAGHLLRTMYGYDADQARTAASERTAAGQQQQSMWETGVRTAADLSQRQQALQAGLAGQQVAAAGRQQSAQLALEGQQQSAAARIAAARIAADSREKVASQVAGRGGATGDIKYPPTMTVKTIDPVTRMPVDQVRTFVGVNPSNNLPYYVTDAEMQALAAQRAPQGLPQPR